MNSKKVNSVLKGVAVAGATIGGVSSIQGADVVMAAELESNSADSMSSDVASQSESVSDSVSESTNDRPSNRVKRGVLVNSEAEEAMIAIQETGINLGAENEMVATEEATAKKDPAEETAKIEESVSIQKSTLLSDSAVASESLSVENSEIASVSQSASVVDASESASILASESEYRSTSSMLSESMSVAENIYNSTKTEFDNSGYRDEHLEELKPNRARESMREHYDMAQMSKALATICTDSPIEFSYEKAKLGNLYTKEAFLLCRQLEFKNLLNRFDSAAVQEDTLEQEFFTCADLAGCEALFAKAEAGKTAGVSLVTENGRVFGAGLALNEEEIYYIPVEGMITEGYLCGKLEGLLHKVSESNTENIMKSNTDDVKKDPENEISDVNTDGTLKYDKKCVCALDVKALLKHIKSDDPMAVFDAGVAAYLLNPLKSSYTYDDMAKEYLNGRILPAREELLGKKTVEKAWEESAEGLTAWACYMAYTALACRKPMCEALCDTGMWNVYTQIELPLIFTLDSMEKWGISVKSEELKSYGEKLSVRIGELEKQIWQQAGEEFNINSPKQMGVILFEKLGLKGGKKTKTGYSTAADILEKLAPEYPIVKDILEYRQLAKLKSTYADGLVGEIAEDGRIHSTFNQTITATGRISSTEPNLQNIPVRMELGRLIRKVFVPEEGYVFLDADYSQIELRVLAHMSGDEKLIQAYKEAQDIHRHTASEVFHVPFDEVTDLQRRNAKAVNFGIVYGISSFGLSQDLSITRKEAAEYIERYFETYPKIKGFLDGLVEEGKEKGYVTTMFGRRRPIPELKSGNFMQRSFGERVAMNSPIQGTAADIIKIAMNRVYRRLKDENLKSRLVLQVHDELLIETCKEEIPQVSAILEEEMKGAAKLSVELEVDMHQGNNWYEAK